MRLSKDQIADLRGMSSDGAYQAIRDLVREEHGVVDRDELGEALEDAVTADILEERDIRRIEDGW